MIGSRSARVVLGLAAGVLLSNCANSGPREDTAAAGDTIAPEPASTQAEPEQAAPPPDAATPPTLRAAVTVSRTGGLAGYDDRVVIHPDGRLETVRGGETLPSRVTDDWLRRFAEAVSDAPTLPTGEEDDVGADQLIYTVEVDDRRLRFRASTEDPRLRSLRDAIQQLFTS